MDPNIFQITVSKKNGLDKSWPGQRGSFNCTIGFDLEVNFEGYFKGDTLFLTADFERAENFTSNLSYEKIVFATLERSKMKVKCLKNDLVYFFWN